VKLSGLLAVLAILIISAVASSSASAAFTLSTTECTGGTFTNTCWAESATGALLELTGEIPFEALLDPETTFEFLVVLGEEDLNILCPTVHATGLFLQASPLTEDGSVTATITFEGCIVTGALEKRCETVATNKTEPLTGTVALGEAELGKLTFKPTTGTAFIKVPIKTKVGAEKACPATLIGEKTVQGSETAMLEKPLEDLKAHLLAATVKSALTFAELPVELDNLNLNVELKEKEATVEEFWDLTNVA
jgi:hypothetical protein